MFEDQGYKLWDSDKAVVGQAWEDIMLGLAQTKEYLKLFSKKVTAPDGTTEWQFNLPIRAVRNTLKQGLSYFGKMVARKNAEVDGAGCV